MKLLPVSRDYLWSLAAFAALPLASLFASPILARGLGVDGRGQLAGILAPLALAPALAHLGQQEAITVHVSRGNYSLRHIFVRSLGILAASGLAVYVALFISAPVLVAPQYVDTFRLASVYVPAMLLVIAARGVVVGTRSFKALTAERWTLASLRLVVLSLLVVWGHLTVASALATHLTAVFAGGLIVVLTAVKRLSQSRVHQTTSKLVEASNSHRSTIDRTQLLVFGAQSWVSTLGNLVMLRLDQVLMTALAGSRELGLYAVGVSLAELPLVASSALKLVLLPQVARSGRAPRTRAIIGRALLLGIPLCGIAVALAPIGIRTMFGGEFAGATPVAQILLVACIPALISDIAVASLTGLRRPGRAGLATGSGACVSLVGVFLLVPQHGAIGAAVASLVAYSVAAGVAVSRLHAAMAQRRLQTERVDNSGEAASLVESGERLD